MAIYELRKVDYRYSYKDSKRNKPVSQINSMFRKPGVAETLEQVRQKVNDRAEGRFPLHPEDLEEIRKRTERAKEEEIKKDLEEGDK